MSNGGRRRPWFAVRATKVETLETHGCDPWVFHAVTLLRLLGRKGRLSVPVAFRLDTAAFVSLIPEAWLHDKGLKPFLGKLSPPIPFATAVGEGRGRLARAVRVQFPMDPEGVYEIDFLVSANLNDRDYGLFSLRDLIRNFEIVTEGRHTIDRDGRPIEIPNLALIPRGEGRV